MQARRKAIPLLTAREIFDLVRDDLALVEQELARQTAVAFESVSEISSYLLGGGGKRLRPALLLLSTNYASAGKRAPGAIRLAADRSALRACEFAHATRLARAPLRSKRQSGSPPA